MAESNSTDLFGDALPNKNADKRKKHAEYMKAYYARKGRKSRAGNKNSLEYQKKYREINLEACNQRTQKWRDANREYTREYSRKYAAEHPEQYAKRDLKKDYQKQIKRPGYKDYHREHHLRTKFGITVADYEALERSQEGKCAICRKEETQIHKRTGRLCRLAVDHCHKTGKVRGLLCRRCNQFLGNVGEDLDLLQRAIHYLQAALQ